MMNLSNVGFFLLFIFSTTNLCFGCFEHERQALLMFKHSLISDPSNRLSSWNGNNCCQWQGVGCNNATRRVIRLDLPGDLWYPFYQLEGNELHSSLSELTHLSYVDLRENNFRSSPIPKFIGSMTRLRYLNLSYAGFSGVIPHHIGNLSSLRVLGLRDIEELIVDDFTWVARLTSLEILDLGGVNITGARDFDKVLFHMVPSLIELHLSSCGLSNSHFDQTHLDTNITRSTIQTLDLGMNLLEGHIPFFLQNMTSLRVLDLLRNQLNSSIPVMNNLVELILAGNAFSSFQDTGVWRFCELERLDISYSEMLGGLTGPLECSQYNLETLDLSDSGLKGEIPKSLDRLTSLKELHLYGNDFTGTIPESLGNLTSLLHLDISGNELTGSIPTSLGKLTMLKSLSLYGNWLNGTVPFFLGHLSNLEFLYLHNNLFSSISPSLGTLSRLQFLDLSSNLLQGPLPDSIGQLSKLEHLDISNNSLSGSVTESHFLNTPMLTHLDATSNHLLHFKISNDWEPPFQLVYLALRSCKIETEFPSWIQTQTHLFGLLLSNTGLYGPLPNWLQKHPPIKALDLSNNFLTGPLTNLHLNLITNPPNYSIAPRLLLLKNNFFNGSIPDSLCNATDLMFLDLSVNMLSGNIPECFGNLQELTAMILSSNRLSGVIPSSLGKIGSSLSWLQLNNNSFRGQLPETLANFTELVMLDLGENNFSGSIPRWIGEKMKGRLAVLRLHKNNFTGPIPVDLCQGSALQIMDLGENNLTGRIPHCFKNFSQMTRKDAKFTFWDIFDPALMQVIKGNSLEYTKTMNYLVNMDLSSNNLVGEIPRELTFLKGLFSLNLSNNHFTGQIPNSIGDMKSLESLDLSRNNLSGMIPWSISSITFLNHLNLSYNNLSGRIPTGSQFHTFNISIYAGNDKLCGSPLPNRCSADTNYTEKENDDEEEVWLWIYSIASGFITGFLVILGMLALSRKLRLSVYYFVEIHTGIKIKT